MSKNYSGEGKVVDYTAGGVITAGQVVVIGSLVGVALSDAVSGEVISVAIHGVFNLPKVDAAVIAFGEVMSYDVSASEFDDNAAVAASGDITGSCVAMEAKGATTGESILTKLNVGEGIITP